MAGPNQPVSEKPVVVQFDTETYVNPAHVCAFEVANVLDGKPGVRIHFDGGGVIERELQGDVNQAWAAKRALLLKGFTLVQ